MFVGSTYPLKQFLRWTRREILFLLLVGAIPTVAFAFTGWQWLAIPWVPIALLGTAVAFVIGFKNNASYARVWEARTAWGAIINASRAWGMLVKSFVASDQLVTSELTALRRELIDTHLAWVTALRFQLREPRGWETMAKPYNAEYRRKYFAVEELDQKLLEVLPAYLTAEDFAYIATKKNRAAQLLNLQGAKVKQLVQRGAIDLATEMQLQSLLVELYRQQGVCERIKNFPYPRQFATLNLMFVKLFVLLTPLGMLQEFNKLGGRMFWLTIPFSMLVSWVLMSMEKSGEATENPFEGSSNDIPITTLSRNIEIDLREMFDETELPAALPPINNISM